MKTRIFIMNKHLQLGFRSFILSRLTSVCLLFSCDPLVSVSFLSSISISVLLVSDAPAVFCMHYFISTVRLYLLNHTDDMKSLVKVSGFSSRASSVYLIRMTKPVTANSQQ